MLLEICVCVWTHALLCSLRLSELLLACLLAWMLVLLAFLLLAYSLAWMVGMSYWCLQRRICVDNVTTRTRTPTLIIGTRCASLDSV